MNNHRNRLSFHSCEVIDNNIYFSSLNSNGLYKMDINKKEPEFIGFFPNEELDGKHLHGAVKYCDGKLYFAPFSGNCISIYDLEKKQFESIEISNCENCMYSKYYGIQIYKRKIILIPSRMKMITIYDIDTKKIEYHDEWTNGIDLLTNGDIPYFKNGSFIVDEVLFIPYNRSAALIGMNLENYKIQTIYIKECNHGFVDGFFSPFDKSVFLLSNDKSAVCKLKIDTHEFFEYEYINDNIVDVLYPHIKMIDTKKYIMILAYQAPYNLVFDKKTHSFFKKNVYDDELNNKEWNAYFYSGQKISDDEIWLMQTGDYMFTSINNSFEVKNKFELIDANDTEKIRLRLQIERGNIVKEDVNSELNAWLDMILME